MIAWWHFVLFFFFWQHHKFQSLSLFHEWHLSGWPTWWILISSPFTPEAMHSFAEVLIFIIIHRHDPRRRLPMIKVWNWNCRTDNPRLLRTGTNTTFPGFFRSSPDIRDFTQWRRECLTTAFATERNWDDNLVLSTVKLRYATMVFRTAFRTFGAKYKTQFSVLSCLCLSACYVLFVKLIILKPGLIISDNFIRYALFKRS